MGISLNALAVGTVFAGEFRIVRLLGEGGMGAVYVAEQLSTGKLRALKTMHAQLVSNAQLRERFVLETHVGARIDNEHVVDVVAAGVDRATGMPWLAMELLHALVSGVLAIVLTGFMGLSVWLSHEREARRAAVATAREEQESDEAQLGAMMRTLEAAAAREAEEKDAGSKDAR